MSVDMVVVQRFFNEKQTGYYAAAGMIGRALIFFVGPIVAVMFPKLVKSHTEQKPTDVLRFTLLLTAGLCVIAPRSGIQRRAQFDASCCPRSALGGAAGTARGATASWRLLGAATSAFVTPGGGVRSGIYRPTGDELDAPCRSGCQVTYTANHTAISSRRAYEYV